MNIIAYLCSKKGSIEPLRFSGNMEERKQSAKDIISFQEERKPKKHMEACEKAGEERIKMNYSAKQKLTKLQAIAKEELNHNVSKKKNS